MNGRHSSRSRAINSQLKDARPRLQERSKKFSEAKDGTAYVPATTDSTITAKFPSELAWMMWGSFLHAYKAVVERIDKDLKANGALSLAQFEMILRVRDVGGRIRFADLASIMMVSPSRVSRQIDALHSLGYLLREATDKDRRATFAVLTATGERAYQQSLELFLRAFERHFLSHVPQRFATPFVSCLRALINDLDSLDQVAVLVNKTRKRNGLSELKSLNGFCNEQRVTR